MKGRFPYHLLLIISILSTLYSNAQNDSKSIAAKFIEGEITLDGELNEAIWETTDATSNFWQYFPTDSIPAKYQTTIQVAYNETTLFVGIRAEAIDNDFVVSSLRRVFSAIRNDNVTILFDTFNDGTNAFGFGITPFGVRREFLVFFWRCGLFKFQLCLGR